MAPPTAADPAGLKVKPVLALSSEPKARGANRSTKVAGKLKLLPDQSGAGPGAGGVAVATTSASTAALPPAAGADVGPPRRDLVITPPEGQPSTEESDDDGDDEDDGEQGPEPEAEVYNQISLIPEGTARRDALRLTKSRAKSLPRVTAYATANSYRFPDLLKFFNARQAAYHTAPRLLDDAIYTPYVYAPAPGATSGTSGASAPSSPLARHARPQPQTRSQIELFRPTASEVAAAAADADAGGDAPATGDLLGVPELRPEASASTNGAEGAKKAKAKLSKFAASRAADLPAEVFIFKYGTVVIWGMTEPEERRFLSSIKRFEVERLAPDDVEMEDLNYYYANYSRIYNDVITLRKGSSYMTKLSLSHALSQSVKISLFEGLISNTIEETKDVPESISETGRVGMPHKEIMRKIGELFLLRTNINSVGSVLDSPEVFWSYPDLQPLYDAARSYLEIPQRINLLNTRVEVLQDMLQLLKESVSSRHSERLEQIVIALIVLEIVLGIITILVDLYS